jgi:hypothetical protein
LIQAYQRLAENNINGARARSPRAASAKKA